MADAITKDPPAQVIEEPEEPEDDDDEEEDEEEEDEELAPGTDAGDAGDDTCVDSWESENGLVFELHLVDGHEEVIVAEENEVPGKPDVIVGLALSLEDLDEAMEILKEIREEIVNRKRPQAQQRGKVRPIRKA